jgi:hypothetical protein
MAARCKPYRADRTNHHLGRILRRAGVLRPLASKEAGEQARELIPLAAGHAASILRLYLREIDQAA